LIGHHKKTIQMDKYIVDLLKSSSRVIIPDFGAFMVKMNKTKTIFFNEFLKFNDGLVIGYIAKTENIEKSNAAKKVSDFVNRIKQELNSGKPFYIKNLGKLFKDEKGKIQFGQGETEKDQTEPYDETIEPFILINKPELKTDDKKKEIKEQPVEEKKEPVKEIIEPAEEIKQPVGETKETIPESKEPVKETREPVKEKKEKIHYDYTTERKKSKVVLWGSLIIAPIIVIIIIWFVFLRNRPSPVADQSVIVDSTEVEKTAILEDTTKSEDTLKYAESIAAMETEKVESLDSDETQKSAVTIKKYYVVGGCFEIEENADNYVIYLKNKGYNSEKFRKIGILHIVSFNSFEKRTDAVEELIKIINETEPNAWLLYY